MDENHEREIEQSQLAELAEHHRQVVQRRTRHHRVSLRYSYQMKMGRVLVKLDPIEFRILQFLASRPYRAFTRKQIAKAISTPRHPVPPESLDRHVTRLRNALGFFRDYIQTVPYIGYRFRE
jgi:DNA-binding response OmpR family regulator